MKIGDIYPAEKYSELVNEANSLGLLINIQEDGSLLIGEQPEIVLLPQDEIHQLKSYLSDTDYTVIKCMELGVSVADTYPEIHQKRADARTRINELEEVINDSNN